MLAAVRALRASTSTLTHARAHDGLASYSQALGTLLTDLRPQMATLAARELRLSKDEPAHLLKSFQDRVTAAIATHAHTHASASRNTGDWRAPLPSVGEIVDAALAARELSQRSDVRAAAGPYPPGAGPHASSGMRTGAALLTSSGAMYTGCSLWLPLSPAGAHAAGVTPAEQVALIKALGSGEKNFAGLAFATDAPTEHIPPEEASLRMLIGYGDFPVYLASASRTIVSTSVATLLSQARDRTMVTSTPTPLPPTAPVAPDDHDVHMLSTSQALDRSWTREPAALVSHEHVFPGVPVGQWSVEHVATWLDASAQLGQYSPAFRTAAVDGTCACARLRAVSGACAERTRRSCCHCAGAVLLTLHEYELHHMLGVDHPLHRRKLELAIQKLVGRGVCIAGRARGWA